MTLQERQALAEKIFNEATKRLNEECGYTVYTVLLVKMPSDQYLAVEPQIQLREIADWVPPISEPIDPLKILKK